MEAGAAAAGSAGPQLDREFEFDAPRYYDFQAPAASPLDADRWFDTDGPRGLASPDDGKAGGSPCLKVTTVREAAATSPPQPSARPAPKDVLPLLPSQPLASAATLPAPVAILAGKENAPEPAEAAKPVRPSNLVTSWATGRASRVAVKLEEASATEPAGQDGASQQLADGQPPRRSAPRAPVPAPTAAAAKQRREEASTSQPQAQAAPAKPPAKPPSKPPAKRTAPAPAQQPAKRPRRQSPAPASAGPAAAAPPEPSGLAQPVKPMKAGAPNLSTSQRTRPRRFKSTQEAEEEQMAAMQPFRARPYRPGRGAAPRPSVAATEPGLGSAGGRSAVDLHTLRGPKLRPLQHRQSAVARPGTRQRRGSLSPAKSERPFLLEPTAPQPFSFATDARGARRQAQREQDSAGAVQQPRFRAAPVPKSMWSPPRAARPPPAVTVPQPFSLESEALHAGARHQREQQKAEQAERQRQQSEFKAQPVRRGRAFEPAPSERPLTVPDDFELPGDRRSRQRAEFDARVAAKQQEAEEEAARQEAERAEREAREREELRRQMVFHARPMPAYPPAGAGFAPPPLEWTDPQSPQLATEARAKAREERLRARH